MILNKKHGYLIQWLIGVGDLIVLNLLFMAVFHLLGPKYTEAISYNLREVILLLNFCYFFSLYFIPIQLHQAVVFIDKIVQRAFGLVTVLIFLFATCLIFEDNRRGLAAITIADSGNGLTIEEINQINAPFDYNLQKMQNGNRGIGLRYVKAMLDSFYEGQTNLFVNCKKGHGTKITILIPVQEELRDKAKVTDTGIE